MPEERMTRILNEYIAEKAGKPVPVTSDLSALYEVIRSNPNPKARKDAVTYLLKLVDEGHEIDSAEIEKFYHSEKDIIVAAELKRVLNKLKIRSKFSHDPTSKYDRKLSSEQEATIHDETAKLKSLYDKSREAKGAFDKKYKIIGKIADGGMGKIYKGFRLQDSQVVAVKFLLLEELSKNNDRDRIIERFKREGDILRRLNHPNIVKAFEYGEAEGEYFIVMEYVQSVTLEERIQNNPLDFETFKTVILQLCDAVQYLHENGIIHRDIKPGNILIRNHKKPQLKLCDLGLAKDKKNPKLSKFAFIAGTDPYVSPQQAKDARDTDERDDIYSMGKTFYEMLMGRTPGGGEDYVEIRMGDDTASKNINSLIKKCIGHERKDRWQTVKELKSALQETVASWR